MEMTLNLPRNYVEIEEEEMMYLDGGKEQYIGAIGVGLATTCINIVIGGLAAKFILSIAIISSIAAKMGFTSKVVQGIFGYSGFVAGTYVMDKLNFASRIANALDKNNNGWIGVYNNQIWYYTK